MPKKFNVNFSPIAIIRTIVFIFIAWVIFFSYTSIRDFLLSSALFAVRDVRIESSIQFIDTRPLKALIGRNIFSVDIKQIHRQLVSQYPQITQLRVQRQLPDTIVVLARKRHIIAQMPVKGKYLLIDMENVGLYLALKPLPVPMIEGLRFDQAHYVPGTALNVKGLSDVVDILNALKTHKNTAALKVLNVQAANPSKIELNIDGGWKVLIDNDNALEKINMLDFVLNQRHGVSEPLVNYIDVRFKEPIIAEVPPITTKKTKGK